MFIGQEIRDVEVKRIQLFLDAGQEHMNIATTVVRPSHCPNYTLLFFWFFVRRLPLK